MASTNKFFTVSILLALTIASTSSDAMSHPSHAKTLTARLKLDGGDESSNCWDSLFELQACTGEIIMFFLNGETYLGPSCCQAIKVVGHDCWPQILGSLGFTTQESDILEGYCDAEQEHSPPSSPTPTTNV